MEIKIGSRILFTGDSITDSERDRKDFNSLSGYSKLIDGYLQMFNPEYGIVSMNRGISGDSTKTLLDRIEGDLKETRPDIVSILIGINDIWRRYSRNMPTSLEDFMENYRSIIKIVKKYTSQIIILEPYVIPSDSAKEIFREDLDPKINELRKMAAEEKLEYIPLDGIFAELSILNDPKLYSVDGIHPIYGGYREIALEWLKRTNLKR